MNEKINIGDITNEVEKVYTYLKTGWLSILLIVLGFVGYIFAITFFAPISGFFGIIGNVGCGIGIWFLLDKYVIKVDTIKRIQESDTVLAAVILGICLIIAASIHAT